MLAAAWPMLAGAQTPRKIPQVGYVGGSDAAAMGHTLGAFRQGLTELGYVEGQSITLEARWAVGRLERIPELVAELVGLKMDVLVAAVSPGSVGGQEGYPNHPHRHGHG